MSLKASLLDLKKTHTFTQLQIITVSDHLITKKGK